MSERTDGSGPGTSFPDRLEAAVKSRGNPCVVGLDFHVKGLPDFVREALRARSDPPGRRDAILSFFLRVIEQVAPLVPAVKPQVALLEPFGAAGIDAYRAAVKAARAASLLVVTDAKRGDIASSADGYADAFLGPAAAGEGEDENAGSESDALTVNAFLGRDTLTPYLERCRTRGKGIFVLVKTSNPGSGETQDVRLADGRTYAAMLAGMVDELGASLCGASGLSAVGAVVGATHPEQASELRRLMPRAILLVPGYGAQGGTARDAARCFLPGGRGAVVNASRSITHAFGRADVAAKEFERAVRENTLRMIDDITGALAG